MMAAAAAVTRQIRLTSAVTILSTLDPVRVFEDFATVDLISGGRAELIAGRGAFVESFPLFGYDLDDYNELFAEKLDLLLRLNAGRARDLAGAFPLRRLRTRRSRRGPRRRHCPSGSARAATPITRPPPRGWACR